MEKIYILTQYSLTENKRNMNAYQRIFYGARYGEIHLLIRRQQSVSQELAARVTLHRAPWKTAPFFFSMPSCLPVIYVCKAAGSFLPNHLALPAWVFWPNIWLGIFG